MNSHTLNSWSDLNEFLDRYKSGFIFRGQPESYENLCSAFARVVTKESRNLTDAVNIEGRAVLDFSRIAHRHLRPEEMTPLRTVNADAMLFGERLDWLALMQHYGAPTRLLDWTESPFVAAYFSVEKNWTEPGELWVCDVNALRDAAARQLVFKSPEKELHGHDSREELHTDIDASPLVRALREHDDRRPGSFEFDSWREKLTMALASSLNVVCEMRQIHVDLLALENEALCSLVFPMALRTVTDRIHAQQGWFTVPLDPRLDHSEAQSMNGVAIEKFVIPANLKREFLRKLRSANVAGHALFPGLDGLGRSVGEQIRLDAT